MLVRARRFDERGSALVSVVVVMLVLTLLAMTLGAIVTNTSSTLAGGRSMSQARAAADAGIAAALAGFRRAQACPGTITSGSAPVYSVTCSQGAGTVEFTSTGAAPGGEQVIVAAQYGYTTAQAYQPKVGLLSFFSATAAYAANVVTSATPDPTEVVVAVGDFHCRSSMAANVVVQNNFYAYSGCAVAGWMKVKGATTMYAGSLIGGDLTTGGAVTLSSVSSVGGSLVSGGIATVSAGSSVGKDLTAVGRVSLGSGGSVGGSITCTGYADLDPNSRVTGNVNTGDYADLDSGVTVGGNLTARTYADIDGSVGGDTIAGTYVVTGDNSTLTGSVKAAGTARTTIHGTVGSNVWAVGPVTTHYDSVVEGDVTAKSTSTTTIYGAVHGNVTVGGPITIDYDGTVDGNVSAVGKTTTSLVYGRITGSLKVAGALRVDNSATVSGPVTAAGTGLTSVFGRLGGSLKVAGTVTIDYNASIGSDVASTGSGTNNVYGTISGNLSTGGNVYLPAGLVTGNLTKPSSKTLTPADARPRVLGTVTSKAAPAAPAAPVAPTFSIPVPVITVAAPVAPVLPQFKDYGYSSADWPGYSLQVIGKSSPLCSDRDWATFLGSFTQPTIVDATACNGGLFSHPSSMTDVTIAANVVVVSTEIDLQYLTFKAATGTAPSMWFIVPSAAGNLKQYAGVLAGTGDIYLDSSKLGVPAMLYTPKRITFRGSTFSGSMYAAGVTFDSATPGAILATPLGFPIALTDGAQTSAGVFSVARISQREVR